MLKIRLQRVGRKHEPAFKIVLTDSKNGTKSGKFLEVLGSHDFRFGEPQIKADRVKYWIGKGAQVSDTMHNLLVEKKVVEGKKRNVLPQKTPIVKKEAEVKA
ncbi:MAG: small subunit ribosomal protein [Patescibacteria group bacterium]|jgi:small subunit ribosomal protein S16|nr:small subunit ribosomal protein [Patescibacteria group bacterium]